MRKTNLNVEEVLTHASLPKLPEAIVRILDVTGSPEAGVEEMLRIAQEDQELNHRILQAVNSGFYDLSRQCVSMAGAMARWSQLLSASPVQTALWRWMPAKPARVSTKGRRPGAACSMPSRVALAISSA